MCCTRRENSLYLLCRFRRFLLLARNPGKVRRNKESVIGEIVHYIANGIETISKVKPSNFRARETKSLVFKKTGCYEFKWMINDQFKMLDSLVTRSLPQVPKYLKVIERMKCLFPSCSLIARLMVSYFCVICVISKWRNVLKIIRNKAVNFVNLITKLFCSKETKLSFLIMTELRSLKETLRNFRYFKKEYVKELSDW